MHINSYLGVCPGFGWQGGPEFKTQIVELNSGRERRNALWQDSRHRYSAPFLNISKEDYKLIKKMHLVCRGQLNCFRFKDELDYQAFEEEFAIGDGITKKFQLRKISSIDGVSYIRNVYALPSIPIIKKNGTLISSGFTIDLDRGLIEFITAPLLGEDLKWTGDFDVWVRFNQDYLPFTLDNPDATNGQIDLIEVAPPAEVV